MKCGACGYKKITFGIDSKNHVNPDDYDFLELDSAYAIYVRGSGERAEREANLYACPKCGTVRVNDLLRLRIESRR